MIITPRLLAEAIGRALQAQQRSPGSDVVTTPVTIYPDNSGHLYADVRGELDLTVLSRLVLDELEAANQGGAKT